MKKVLIVAGSLPPIKCGVGYYSARLAKELSSEGVDFEILSTEGVDKDIPARLQNMRDWKIGSIGKMLKAIDQSGAEVIHIQYPAIGYRRNLGINLLPYALRLFRSRLKVIVTLHEYHGSRWLGRVRDFITIVPAHKIAVSNRADKSALPKWLARKAVLIPIGSNLDKVTKNPKVYEQVMSRAGLDTKKPILLFFGFAYPAKGLDQLLQAIAEPYLSDWQLLMLSNLDNKDSYQGRLLEKIEDINSAGRRAVASGFLPDGQVSAILQEGKYFILPQSAPISAKSSTAITAVQHELILISKNAKDPGFTEPFKHGDNCYLLGTMTGPQIAEAVKSLEGSPASRQKIASGAKALQDYFSWPAIVQKHIKLYGEL